MPRTPGFACAALLLAGVLSCALAAEQQERQGIQASPITCVKQKTPLDCDLKSDCVWCEKSGTSFGRGCYPIAMARLLPAKWGVECDKDLNPSPKPERAEQQQQKEASSFTGVCDGKPEAQCTAPACVWCTSAAVGGGCYTPEEAKLLPKAIFKCKTAPTEDAEAAAIA